VSEALDDEERQLRMDLMRTQIDLLAKQSRWEVPKALAAFLGATALMVGATLGLANWIGSRQQQPQPIIIQLPANAPVK
jgi:hypothetical protein